MANDDCTVLSAAFPDGERISLSAGELKQLKQLAREVAPGSKKKATADAEPKKGRR